MSERILTDTPPDEDAQQRVPTASDAIDIEVTLEDHEAGFKDLPIPQRTGPPITARIKAISAILFRRMQRLHGELNEALLDDLLNEVCDSRVNSALKRATQEAFDMVQGVALALALGPQVQKKMEAAAAAYRTILDSALRNANSCKADLPPETSGNGPSIKSSPGSSSAECSDSKPALSRRPPSGSLTSSPTRSTPSNATSPPTLEEATQEARARTFTGPRPPIFERKLKPKFGQPTPD